MPLVSVILPTCDRPELVGRALRSVLAQAEVDFEVLLVDSNRACEPLRSNADISGLLTDERVRLIEPVPRPSSAASARNAALPLVKGDWVSYLDDDDEYLPGKLTAQIELAVKTNLPLVLSGYTFVWPSGRRRIRQCGSPVYRGDELLFGADFMTSLILHRRDAEWKLDETVRSGDDRLATLQFFRRRGITEVPCVCHPLVTIYCQEQSVHKNSEAAWAGCLSGVREARRGRFSRKARHQFLLAGMIERAARGHGNFPHLCGLSVEWLQLTGLSGWRFVAYGIVTRLGLDRS
ncbi:glycosyltransferase [Opitutaceae bacterium]|nr:glycosyltransferase [Opitutaceae bacterium]